MEEKAKEITEPMSTLILFPGEDAVDRRFLPTLAEVILCFLLPPDAVPVVTGIMISSSS